MGINPPAIRDKDAVAHGVITITGNIGAVCDPGKYRKKGCLHRPVDWLVLLINQARETVNRFPCHSLNADSFLLIHIISQQRSCVRA